MSRRQEASFYGLRRIAHPNEYETGAFDRRKAADAKSFRNIALRRDMGACPGPVEPQPVIATFDVVADEFPRTVVERLRRSVERQRCGRGSGEAPGESTALASAARPA